MAIFLVSQPLSMMYHHLPKLCESSPFLITLEVQLSLTMVIVPPSWYTERNGSTALYVAVEVCCQVQHNIE